MNRKKFLDSEKTTVARVKEADQRFKDHVSAKQEKGSYNPKDLQFPLPSSIKTFAHDEQYYKKNPIHKGRDPKGKGFGMTLRFPVDAESRWNKKVKTYNAAVDGDKQLDPKKDMAPGPAGYSMISYWKGKKPRKEKDEKKVPNYFSQISTGPKISAYYGGSAY